MPDTKVFINSLLLQLRSELNGGQEDKVATRDKLAVQLGGLIDTTKIMIQLSADMGKITPSQANKKIHWIKRAEKHLSEYQRTPVAYRDRRICVVMKNIVKVHQQISCSFQN